MKQIKLSTMYAIAALLARDLESIHHMVIGNKPATLLNCQARAIDQLVAAHQTVLDDLGDDTQQMEGPNALDNYIAAELHLEALTALCEFHGMRPRIDEVQLAEKVLDIVEQQLEVTLQRRGYIASLIRDEIRSKF